MESIKIFEPPEEWKSHSRLKNFMDWVNIHHNLEFNDYQALWQWSVSETGLFWRSILEYFKVDYGGDFHSVYSSDSMPGVKWFEGIELNYASHLTRNTLQEQPALIACNESGRQDEMYWPALLEGAAALQIQFDRIGLEHGDRVVAYLPNIPEASTAFLACAASGLVWSSCAPEFGSASVIDRIRQIKPKVLIATDHYVYGGKRFDRTKELNEIIYALDDLEFIVLVDSDRTLNWAKIKVQHWEDLVQNSPQSRLRFDPLPFDHPLWILYSSGTTGLPKAITHSHGGMLLEHLKYIHFHNDVNPGDLFFWFTTTGWMMWNYLHATWLAGATLVLYDGHPSFPHTGSLWEMADRLRITHFGCGAPLLHQAMNTGLKLPQLPGLRSISSTGSPLSEQAFRWIYNQRSDPFYLWSMSGGTDMCTAFVGGNPLWPVYTGEIQCRALGCALEVWNEDGQPVVNEVGEMVIVKPMPCMPVYFWNDPGNEKYIESYFNHFPGVWRHGDWAMLTLHSGIIITGRSDTTLKRFGVRIGTAEIYSALQSMQEIADSLIIYLDSGGLDYMPLFVKLKTGISLDEQLILDIKSIIRVNCSPRHVPDAVFRVTDIPYTLSGKKMETAVKKIFIHRDINDTIAKGAMRNPECLDEYLSLARQTQKS